MMENDEDNFLYGDLEATGRDAEMQRLRDMVESEQKKYAQQSQDVQALKDQISILVVEKTQLEKNIVAVYNTALREIKRKDLEITALRSKRTSNS